jgi:alpha-tubulin suppressor-like RCC1 family protein
LQDTDDGLYRVRVTTDAGEVFSRVATVVAVHPPVITNQTPELNIYRPQGAPFELLAVGVYSKGTDRLAYDWYHDGQGLANAISPFGISSHLPLSFGSTNNEGAYHVIVRNIAGSATSAVWTVNIRLRGESTGWGDNSYGQLDSSRAETNLVAVAAGALHNLGLRENATVVAWGDNFYGQTNVPAGLTNVIAIASGNGHSLALREDRTVTAWGWNFYGQTNIPASATNVIGIAAGSDHSLALRANGTVVGWGDSSFGCLNIPADLTNAMQVAAGDGLSYALLSNGTVRAWGSGGLGAVTVPTNLANVVQIAAAHTHGLALKSDGTVIGLGQDSGWGETMPPTGLSNVLQISVGFMFSVALRNDGSVVAWGRYDYGQTNVPPNLGDVKQVSAGGYHALALAYNPVLNYPVTVPQDLLLIYNTNCPDSAAVMNYYRTNRPGIAAANVLGIGGATNAIERYTNRLETTNILLVPYQQWLANNPTKRPNYIVLMYGVPASPTPPPWPCAFCGEIGVSVLLRDLNLVRKPFAMHLNMRTPQDCFAYVDKLRYFGTNYSPGRIYISPRSGGYGNTNYYFDDVFFGNHANYPGLIARNAVLLAGANPTNVFYTVGQDIYNAHFFDCTNAASYLSWGVHGLLGANWSVSGVVKFHGASSWYPMQTIESFNGQWEPLFGQNSFHNWFASETFGGTNYSYAAVGGVSHLYEPSVGGANNGNYFGLWEHGKCFAVCAWLSQVTAHFQATGDPFVIK